MLSKPENSCARSVAHQLSNCTFAFSTSSLTELTITHLHALSCKLNIYCIRSCCTSSLERDACQLAAQKKFHTFCRPASFPFAAEKRIICRNCDLHADNLPAQDYWHTAGGHTACVQAVGHDLVTRDCKRIRSIRVELVDLLLWLRRCGGPAS